MVAKKKAHKVPAKRAEKAGRKELGLGISPPDTVCEDKNCAWHGSLPVRGKVFWGIVKATKMSKTAVIEWGYHRFVRKYESYERRKSKVIAHNPPCMHARDGDQVVIAECRPLSKTKSFVIVGIEKRKGES